MAVFTPILKAAKEAKMVKNTKRERAKSKVVEETKSVFIRKKGSW
jgi:hypothetical protein